MLTGHRIDTRPETAGAYADHPDLTIGDLITSDDVDLRPYCPPVWNQIANDCCAHGTAAALMIDAYVRGKPIAEPSKLWLYALARIEEHPKQPLVDHGSTLRHMWDGMKGRGVCAETRWPETLENVDAIPPDDCWDAAEKDVIKSYSVIADGQGAAFEVEAALRRYRTPTICMGVDKSFADTIRGVYDGPRAPIDGSHCMICVGYSKTLDAFMLRNSWGPGAHDGGYVWISRRFLIMSTYEKYVLEISDLPSDA